MDKDEYKLTEEEKMLLKASQDFYSLMRYERKCENCGGKYPFSKKDILSKKVTKERQVSEGRSASGWIKGVYEEYEVNQRYIKCPICDYEEEIE